MPLTRFGPLTSSRAMTRAAGISVDGDPAAGGARPRAGVDHALDPEAVAQVDHRLVAPVDAAEEVVDLVHVHPVVGGLEAERLPLAARVVVGLHVVALEIGDHGAGGADDLHLAP